MSEKTLVIQIKVNVSDLCTFTMLRFVLSLYRYSFTVTPGGEFVVDEGAEIILRLFGSVYSLLLTLTSHPRPQIKWVATYLVQTLFIILNDLT